MIEVPILVSLTEEEMATAKRVAEKRNSESITAGYKDKHGYVGDRLIINITGAYGELVFCKGFNITWSESVNTFKAPDVGSDIQIRTMLSKWRKLTVRPDDDPKQRYVLVTGEPPNFRIEGWLYGYEAMQDKWEETYGGRPPAWFVPHTKLNHDFSSFMKE